MKESINERIEDACQRSYILYCDGQLDAGLALAEFAYNASQDSESPTTRAIAARSLATRLRDKDLRRNWSHVQTLLGEALSAAKASAAIAEIAEAAILLADCAQCRREFELANSMLETAFFASSQLHDGFQRSELLAQTCEIRALRDGRHDRSAATNCIEEGLILAPDEYRRASLKIQLAYLSLPDADGALEVLHSIDCLGAFSMVRPRPWHAIESELLFSKAALALRAKRYSAAVQSAKAALLIADRSGSTEVASELRVLLAACLFAAKLNTEAQAVAHQARAICNDASYDDLLQDLNRVVSRAGEPSPRHGEVADVK